MRRRNGRRSANERRSQLGRGNIHGCVTTGTNWRFTTLTGTHMDIDLAEYHISQADQIFGILMHMIGATPAVMAA